jgi:hypothetical protein
MARTKSLKRPHVEKNPDGSCKHKTADDHSYLVESNLGKRRIWICSGCKHRACWSDGWVYDGNIECYACQTAAIHTVYCPACAKAKGIKPEALL